VVTNANETEEEDTMAKLGRNWKWTAPMAVRETMGAMFRDVLKAEVLRPAPHLEVYVLEGGARVGVYFVDSDQALDPALVDRAPWLEFLVDDPAQARAGLARIGIEPFAYTDEAHDYFRAPGGPVFRIARDGA
jgi:hypothetical protein